jgi:hypothetical protein
VRTEQAVQPHQPGAVGKLGETEAKPEARRPRGRISVHRVVKTVLCEGERLRQPRRRVKHR